MAEDMKMVEERPDEVTRREFTEIAGAETIK